MFVYEKYPVFYYVVLNFTMLHAQSNWSEWVGKLESHLSTQLTDLFRSKVSPSYCSLHPLSTVSPADVRKSVDVMADRLAAGFKAAIL